MIGISVLLVALVSQGLLVRWAGWFLLMLLAGFLWFLFKHDVAPEVPLDPTQAPPRRIWSSLQTALGVAMLAAGASLLVDGAMNLAQALGVSNRLIGLTLVALGTSLPELATVTVAALRRETDLILGNLIGSNVFNILGIMGTTIVVHPLRIVFADVWIDLAVMLGLAVAIWPMLIFRGQIGRRRGATLLAVYLVYVVAIFF
jgi:cation:H+ antiporter